GYNSSQCLNELKNKFDTYKPKIVLVMAGMDNAWNFIDSNYFKIKQFKDDNQFNYQVKYIDALLSNSKIYKLIKLVYMSVMARLEAGQFQYKYGPSQIKKLAMPQRSHELTQLLNKGLQYFEEGKYELSEVCYRNALKLSPYDYEPHWYMGRFYNFRGERQKAKDELILAAKNTFDPYTVIYILADLQEQSQPVDSDYFKGYAGLVKSLRTGWVNKFGEEPVRRFIDPMISYEESDLWKILAYDLEEMGNYLKLRNSRLVILTYPCSAATFRCPWDIYHRIASKLDSPLVNNASLFSAYLRYYRNEELFVADGHCTGKGYRLMAENIFETLKKYNLLN
ncbi:MAG: hypothetical protein Q7S42_04820, partial [Candidatus Omnitrophota bacterium]|nr:hypothetical protein [Candidatus Omnitrophota bacterium]